MRTSTRNTIDSLIHAENSANAKSETAKHTRRRLLPRALLLAAAAVAAISFVPTAASAQPVQYVKICSAYGAYYYYIPGNDRCAYSGGMPYKVQSPYGTVTNTPGANATAYGDLSFAYGDQSLAIGDGSWAGGNPTSGSPGVGYYGYNGMSPGSVFFNSGTTALGANTQAGAGAAGQVNATAVGESATANAAGATAVGQASNASGNSSTAVGNNAVASGSNATALGANSVASKTNSVALGAGSVADQSDTVSVGSAGNERRITNVAAGTAPTDAVNYSQFERLDQRLSNKIDVNRTGVAMALAMSGIGGLQQNEHFMMSANWGTYEGANAGGLAMAARITKHTSLNAGVGFGSGTVGARAGVRFGW